MAPSNFKTIKRALVSVSDKTELMNLATYLIKNNIEILSTGGTASLLKKREIPVRQVSDYTGFSEIMGGRVKTLHPKVHGALLRREGNDSDAEAMKELDIIGIDLVIANLYPFEDMASSGKNYHTCIENIDIGGPAMIRSAAKNHQLVTIIVDPSDYACLVSEMDNHNGKTSISFRKRLAAKAFQHTAYYDATIAGWFSKQINEQFPETLVIPGKLKSKLRYGENPHQSAAFYETNLSLPGVGSSIQLQGKELSYNNLNDTDAAFELISEFEKTSCAIIKHSNPCGVATASSAKKAYIRALSCDPESAFGGVVALNVTIDAPAATEIVKLFIEVVIAPKITRAAQKILGQKQNLRVLETGGLADKKSASPNFKSLSSGFLIQDHNSDTVSDQLKIVTKRKPSQTELRDLLLAFTVCKHVKSNAIVYAKGGMTVGIGAGQMSRVNSSRIAAWKAEDASIQANEKKSRAIGSVVASDAFFPFADGLVTAADAGVTAIIQPGGSIRDEEVIKAADERELAMIFTGIRHFRH